MSGTFIGSSGVTFPDSSVQATAATGFGFHNRIINGAMVIDQRNAGASLTVPSAAQTYTLDRFYAQSFSGSKFTIQQNAGSVTPPVGFTKYLGLTSSAATSPSSTDYYGLATTVEGQNMFDFAWGSASASTVTLSFWVRSSLTGTFSGAIVNGTTNRSYVFTYSVSSANTWEQKTVTIVGDTTGTWATDNTTGLTLRFNIGTGSNYLSGSTGWQAGNYYGTTGSVSIIGTNGATFYITGVQLEKGSTATSFDYRPYGTEFQLCQRYYETGFFSYENGVSGNSQATYSFQALKRTTSPTVSYTNVSAPATGTQSVFQVGQSQFAMKNASASGAIYWNATWTATAEL